MMSLRTELARGLSSDLLIARLCSFYATCLRMTRYDDDFVLLKICMNGVCISATGHLNASSQGVFSPSYPQILKVHAIHHFY